MPLAAAVRSARCARPGRRSCPSNSFDSPAPLLPIIPLGKEAAGPLHFEEGRRAAVSASDEFQRECDLNHRAPLGGVRDCCAEFAVSSPYHFAPGPSLGGSGNSCRLAMTHAGNLGNGGLSDDRPGGRPGLREGTREGASAKAGISGQAGNTYRQSEGSVPDWRRGAGRASSADRTAGARRKVEHRVPRRCGVSVESLEPPPSTRITPGRRLQDSAPGREHPPEDRITLQCRLGRRAVGGPTSLPSYF